MPPIHVVGINFILVIQCILNLLVTIFMIQDILLMQEKKSYFMNYFPLVKLCIVNESDARSKSELIDISGNSAVSLSISHLFFLLNCLQAVLMDVLRQFLPEDIHIRSTGRVRGKFLAIFLHFLIGCPCYSLATILCR